jgi:hypothetical protein
VLLIGNCHSCSYFPPDLTVALDRSPTSPSHSTITRWMLFYSESQQWRPSALVAPIRKETPRPRKAKHPASSKSGSCALYVESRTLLHIGVLCLDALNERIFMSLKI